MILRGDSIRTISSNLKTMYQSTYHIVNIILMAIEENNMEDAYKDYLENEDLEFTWDVFEAVLKRVITTPKSQTVSTKLYTEVKQGISLKKAKNRVARRWQEEELIGLLLYKGNLSMGKAQGLLNYLLIMLDAGIEDIGQISRLSRESKDIRHLAGLHSGITIDGLKGFLYRVRHNPKVTVAEPLLLEYADHLTGGIYPKLTPISRWSRRTPQSWRYQKPNKRTKKRKQPVNTTLVPEFYPFIVDDPTEEHELLMAVHDAVPKGLPRGIREDVCQDLLVAILSNEFTLTELPDKIKPFITQTWRMYPGKYGPLSLDQPPPWNNDGQTLLEKISDEVQLLR